MAMDWAEGLTLFGVIIIAILGTATFAAALLAVGILCLLLVGGVLWSPVAAVICGIIARARGLEAIDMYIAAGFTSSCCLFGPWVYLVSRMCGTPLPADTVITTYWMLFLLWAFGTWVPGVALSVTYFWVENPEFGPFSANADRYDPRGTVTVITIATLVPVVSFILCVQKRISTQIFGRGPKGLDNPPPGTIIDHTITRKGW